MATIYFTVGDPFVRWELGSPHLRWLIDDVVFYSVSGRIP